MISALAAALQPKANYKETLLGRLWQDSMERQEKGIFWLGIHMEPDSSTWSFSPWEGLTHQARVGQATRDALRQIFPFVSSSGFFLCPVTFGNWWDVRPFWIC